MVVTTELPKIEKLRVKFGVGSMGREVEIRV